MAEKARNCESRVQPRFRTGENKRFAQLQRDGVGDLGVKEVVGGVGGGGGGGGGGEDDIRTGQCRVRIRSASARPTLLPSVVQQQNISRGKRFEGRRLRAVDVTITTDQWRQRPTLFLESERPLDDIFSTDGKSEL